MSRLSAFVLRRQRNVVMTVLHRRQMLHSGGVSRKLPHLLSVDVDVDALSAVHLVPLQRNSSAIVLHDARVDSAAAINAGLAAIGLSGFPSASAHGSNGDANCLLLDVSDHDLVVASSNLHDFVVVMRTALARRRAVRTRAGTRTR